MEGKAERDGHGVNGGRRKCDCDLAFNFIEDGGCTVSLFPSRASRVSMRGHSICALPCIFVHYRSLHVCYSILVLGLAPFAPWSLVASVDGWRLVSSPASVGSMGSMCRPSSPVGFTR